MASRPAQMPGMSSGHIDRAPASAGGRARLAQWMILMVLVAAACLALLSLAEGVLRLMRDPHYLDDPVHWNHRLGEAFRVSNYTPEDFPWYKRLDLWRNASIAKSVVL